MRESKGRRLFRDLVRGKQAEWATRLNKSRQAVNAWANGERTPKQPERVAIHEAGGPEPQAWDEVALEVSDISKRQRADVSAGARATPEAVQTAADRLMGQAQALLTDLEAYAPVDDVDNDGGLTARIAAAERLASLLSALGKHTGHTIVNARQILASPSWREVREAVTEALEPYPEAMHAVASALLQLESES